MKILAAVTLLLAEGTLALAREQFPDQYKDSPPAVRQWFKGVRSQQGIPCCDVADGHRTDWQARADGYYWVFVLGEWRRVPKVAVVSGTENPTGDAVVWYVDNKSEGPNGVFIRCFVPGPEQ